MFILRELRALDGYKIVTSLFPFLLSLFATCKFKRADREIGAPREMRVLLAVGDGIGLLGLEVLGRNSIHSKINRWVGGVSSTILGKVLGGMAFECG